MEMEKVEQMDEVSEVAWYPPVPCTDEAAPSSSVPITIPAPAPHVPHPSWNNELKYTSVNWWCANIKRESKEACRHHHVHGVEVRDLGKDHFLCGERGLFATEKFSRFDIIGEYCGRVVDDTINGHYVACLEDKAHSDSLGVNAEDCGNEIRYINSYLNVAFKPNVTMRTAYVNTYPHIMVVCTEDIEIGEELLLDYGKSYNEAYLLPKPSRTKISTMDDAEAFSALPGSRSSSEDELDPSEQR
jgi:hypothetical protein